MSGFEHEQIVVQTGERSRLPIIVAIHSTALGQAVGGCRMWAYPVWQDALADAFRLSEAMTWKCALADLPFGGGKSVIALPDREVLDADRRRAVMLDLGDMIQSLAGRYGVGEDVGTTADDMWVARERTPWAYCVPPAHGGSGEPAEPTAVGVLAAIAATCRRRFGTDDLSGRRFTVIGLGQVGSRVAHRLAAAGAQLIVTDVDASKRSLVADLDATWVDPDAAFAVDTDVLIPAALGGLLSARSIPRLSCAAVVGPANNQLEDTDAAKLLDDRGILWAPDFVVNAGGVIYGCLVDICGGAPEDAMREVERVGDRLEQIFADADTAGVTPHEAALRLARQRVADAGANATVAS
jgi:leucine dehydrogenase